MYHTNMFPVKQGTRKTKTAFCDWQVGVGRVSLWGRGCQCALRSWRNHFLASNIRLLQRRWCWRSFWSGSTAERKINLNNKNYLQGTTDLWPWPTLLVGLMSHCSVSFSSMNPASSRCCRHSSTTEQTRMYKAENYVLVDLMKFVEKKKNKLKDKHYKILSTKVNIAELLTKKAN